jgi:signal transduction histidine kinase/ActR/RegA family two-component response regulator
MHHDRDDANHRMSVPILLPTGRDAELVGNTLDQAGIYVAVCASIHEMLDQIRVGYGPFVIAAEALSDNDAERLMGALEEQPEWSDLPGFILIGRSAGQRALDSFTTRREISLIQRPVKKSLFINMIQTAVEARRRQYQVRNLLQELVYTNEKLGSQTILLQQLALELTKVEDLERQRIARILHDDLQQMLASAKLQTEMLIDVTKAELTHKVQVVSDIISNALRTTRSLSHELNPAFVHGENLGTALKRLTTRMAENYGFQVQSTIEAITDRIAEDIKVFVYRSMQELLFNCAKHAAANALFVEVTNRGDILTASITDDGVGFDSSGLKINGGSEGGFGLYSIQQRAIALGGSFSVCSVPDKGSRFILKIPLLSEDEATVAVKSELPASDEDMEPHKKDKSDAITVMIADDHAVMRQGLASLLRNQPDIAVVAEAADGEQAIAFALHFRPAVVLMDFSMPLLNGTDATRRIKQKAPEIVVIGLSMHSAQDIEKKMLDAGAQAYLTKDVQAKELVAIIKRYAKT